MKARTYLKDIEQYFCVVKFTRGVNSEVCLPTEKQNSPDNSKIL